MKLYKKVEKHVSICFRFFTFQFTLVCLKLFEMLSFFKFFRHIIKNAIHTFFPWLRLKVLFQKVSTRIMKSFQSFFYHQKFPIFFSLFSNHLAVKLFNWKTILTKYKTVCNSRNQTDSMENPTKTILFYFQSSCLPRTQFSLPYPNVFP